MCTFKITNSNKELSIDKFLKLGGPTLSKNFSIDSISFTHNLLSITGEVTPQPIIKDNNLYMLLGEIYNYDKNYPSDIYSVIENYELYKDNLTNYLDGEFLIIIYNIDKKIINFYTDPWSTKMIWYDIFEDYFYFGSFSLTNSSKRLLHNSHYTFDFKNKSLNHVNNSLHTWDLTQYKNNYIDWEVAFIKAVEKRYHKDIVLTLSGGIDSMSIAACLSDLNLSFDTITLNIYPLEDTKSLESIYKYINNSCINSNFISSLGDIISINSDFLSLKNLTEYPFNYLCSIASINNKKVILTGQGADEILDNYIFKNYFKDIALKMSFWPEDLKSIFPYDHFYENKQRCLIDMQQYVSLAYGIETRNPFLDKNLTQEWLWISSDLKNTETKGPIKNFLLNRNIHLPKTIVGLGDQNISENPILKKIFL